MKTYWFGRDIESMDLKDEGHWKKMSDLNIELATTTIDKIVTLLDKFSHLWTPGSALFEKAIGALAEESGLKESEVRSTLCILPKILKRESLEARLRAEFLLPEVLDNFTKLPMGSSLVKASPRGVTLHITAGNVFLSSIDSLIMGLITKNISLVKVSRQNTFFPFYFAHALRDFDEKKVLSDKFAILYWRGGDEATESFLKKKVDTIVAWGGEEMVRNYQRDLGESVKFLDFGPKISLQFISLKGLMDKDISKVAKAIVSDIIPWNQGACASAQNLFVQEGIDTAKLMQSIDDAFNSAPERGDLSEDESVEILKERYRALYSQLMDGGMAHQGQEHLLHFESNKFLRPSPLGRTLIVKPFRDVEDLYQHLKPFSYYLQSAAYLLGEDEKNEYLQLLSLSGLKRFAPVGTLTWGMDGAPHDGRFVLRELVHFIADESRAQDYGEAVSEVQSSSKLKEYFENSFHPKGYIFSSGGTTGTPKYVHFSYQEFDRSTDMLAYNFRAQEIAPGTMVANLFVAGNLWSSFLAVERALEKIGAIQLPIGGLCPVENILQYLTKFNPQVVMGIPSLLVMIAEKAISLNISLNVKKVFYAGEAMSPTRCDFLRKHWGVEYFGSAGYASVDAGVIGYQCFHCGPGEHHLFTDMVDLKIINSQGIVTSLSRSSLPIKNYATGDRMEFVEGECQCGRSDRKFRLLGRIDNQIQIWSCRLLLTDIENSLKSLDPEILSYQVVLSEKGECHSVVEWLDLEYEISSDPIDEDKLLREIYHNSRDLKDTISFEFFSQRCKVIPRKHGEIRRNSRTGKISLILDNRGLSLSPIDPEGPKG
jgi:phenylacetate-CoA ligase